MRPNQLVILYILLVVVVGLLVFVTHLLVQTQQTIERDRGVWQCTTLVCAERIDTQQWMAEHCTEGSAGTCILTVNGQQQQIPLTSINLTYLGEQCAKVHCAQEAYIRDVNYSLSLNTSSIIIG